MGDPEKKPLAETLTEEKVERQFAPTELGVGPAPTPPPSAHARSGSSAGSSGGIPPADDDDDDGPDLLLGKVLGGHYKIEDRIGEGGMGTVYRALHVHLSKHFAVKVLSKKIAENKQAVERLRQEAVAASSIDHDNIVDVVHFDATDDGDVFIVMELLKGAPLADIVERGRIGLQESLHISLQICSALHAAHENGIVHRDLKPENVFIVRKNDVDFVKVLDFGISKVKSAETEQVRMTKTGQLVGTPLYMSPEQAKGEADIDRRVDVYALGVILYEMLAGAPPFEGDNYFQLLWKHGNEMPDPPSFKAPDADIPEAVEAIIMKALAKDPSDRFQTMAEMREALLGVAGGDVPRHLVSFTPSHVSGPPLPMKGRGLLTAGLVVAALAFAGVGVAVMSGGDEPTDRDVEAATAQTEIDMAPVEAADPPETNPTPAPIPAGEDDPPIQVRFESTPPGATVRIGDREYGPTPTFIELEPTEDGVEVVFTLHNHRSQTQVVVPAEGRIITARMRRIPRSTGTSGSSSIMMTF
jgi:serine/threonine-protein kinase